MSISKHTNWTRIVPILVTALAVLSFSLLAVRSERCRLTSKAYTNEYQLPKNINLISSQWTTASNNLILYNWGVTGVDNSTYQAVSFRLDCMCNNFDWQELRYNVIIRDNANNVIYQGPNLPVSTDYTFTSNPYTYGSDTVAFRIQVLLFREDGGYIHRDYISYSSLTLNLNVLEQVEGNNLPAEWLQSTAATTTSPFSTMTTIASDLIPDDQMIEQNLTTPPWIEGAVAQILALVSQIIQLRYIRFLLGFVIIVSLVAWFLH